MLFIHQCSVMNNTIDNIVYYPTAECIAYNSIRNMLEQLRRDATPPNTPRVIKNTKCLTCESMGHEWWECPHDPRSMLRVVGFHSIYSGPKKCFTCDSKNHLWKNCPLDPKKPKNPESICLTVPCHYSEGCLCRCCAPLWVPLP